MSKIVLSDEDRKRLEEADSILEDAADGIARLESVGIDVSDLRTRLESTEKMRSALLREF